MLIKAVILFLLAMVAIGMVGKALFPGTKKPPALAKPTVCRSCGRYVIGKAGCDCKKG